MSLVEGTRLSRLLWLVALVGACFNPTIQQGVPCTIDGQCPEDQVCAEDNRCYEPDQIPDFNRNADLVGLLPSQGTLIPAFDPAATEYELLLPLGSEDILVTPTAAIPDGVTIEVSGLSVESGSPSPPVVLNLGDNLLDIVVTPTVGEPRTYTITVKRGAGIVQQAYAKASNTDADDAFGSAVALDGDTLAVGAFGEASAASGVGANQTDDSAGFAGAVYVFRRSGTSWSQEAYIKASNTDPDDVFGSAVALDGDTLAVGAPGEASGATEVDGNENDNSAANAGAVFVFRRNGTNWSQEAYIKASNTDANDLFGSAVALDGETLAVGAVGESSAATGVGGNEASDTAGSAGAVYVFRRSGISWSQEAYVKASNTDANDSFGVAVALHDDTMAVGASREDSAATGVGGNQVDDSATSAGAAYVFRRSGTSWSQEAYIKASNTDANDLFGVAVAVHGDTLAIGAEREASGATGAEGNESDNSADDAGAVYIYRNGGTGWSQEAYLKASNTDGGDLFGRAIDLAGETLLVGASGEDSADSGVNGDQANNGASSAGAAYLFTRSSSSWSQQAYLKASNTDAIDAFGFGAVAVDGDTVVVGARGEASVARGVDGNQADNTAPSSGAIYIFQ